MVGDFSGFRDLLISAKRRSKSGNQNTLKDVAVRAARPKQQKLLKRPPTVVY